MTVSPNTSRVRNCHPRTTHIEIQAFAHSHMARRSERVKAEHESPGWQSPPEDVLDPADEDFEVRKPQRKKKKSTETPISAQGPSAGRKVRGKQGLLKELPEMPLDILFEVLVMFYFLHPLLKCWHRYLAN